MAPLFKKSQLTNLLSAELAKNFICLRFFEAIMAISNLVCYSKAIPHKSEWVDNMLTIDKPLLVVVLLSAASIKFQGFIWEPKLYAQKIRCYFKLRQEGLKKDEKRITIQKWQSKILKKSS